MSPPVSGPARDRDALFIDEDLGVHEGAEACSRLADRSDARFVEGARGVVRVDPERWAEAQRYEKRTWMERGAGAFDDHNRAYLGPFRNYEALRGRVFGRAIELGCGPFTNMRLVLESARVEEVHLLDPLARDYLSHPHCRYRRRRLGGLGGIGLLRAGRGAGGIRLLLEEFRTAIRVGGLRGRPVHLEATSIEDFRTHLRFDLVVMINVLEHCRDAVAVLARIDEILAPGGILVFHDRIWDPLEVERTIGSLYDAGHPLRVGRSVVTPFLDRYESLLREEAVVVDVEDGLRLERTAVHFIGRKGPP
jgi:SAM-dependent methyltransferase